MIQLSEIKLNPNNPRLIKDDKFKKLCERIKANPETLQFRPIVVDKDNVIQGGNMRYRALKELGYKEVPGNWIAKADGFTEEQMREFVVVDNLGYGEWDYDMLANQYTDEELTNWGMDLPEFKVALEAQEDDYEIPDEVKTDIVLGDLFEIGQHRLICGDSTQKETFERLFGQEKADMVLTDPPYNGQLGGAGFKNSPDVKNRINKMQKSIEKIYDFNPSQTLSIIPQFCNAPISMFFFCNKNLVPDYINFAIDNKKGFDLLLWHKPNFLPMGGQHYYPDTEYIIKMRDKGAVFVNGLGKEVNYGTYWVLESLKGAKKEGVQHPTIKPQKILTDCIRITTNASQLVFDAFLGSGSTMVASHQFGRKCYGIELDPKYCQVILERMIKLDPNIEIKRNGKPYKVVSNG